VWQSFGKNAEIKTIEDVNREGWKTATQMEDQYGVKFTRLKKMVTDGKMIQERFKLDMGGYIRTVNLVRPATTSR